MSTVTKKRKATTTSTLQLHHEFQLPPDFPPEMVDTAASLWRNAIRTQLHFWRQRQRKEIRWRICEVAVELVEATERRVVFATELTVVDGMAGCDRAQVEKALAHCGGWFDMLLSAVCSAKPSMAVNREPHGPIHCGQ